MNKTLGVIRIFFLLLCVCGSLIISFSVPEWEGKRLLALFIGMSIGALVILVDIFLKGFSLRGLSALTFGLFAGWLVAMLLSSSPLFNFPYSKGDEVGKLLAQNLYLIRLALYIILMYLGAVIALRGRDEFNLVIPYVRFVPHGVNVPLVVVDTSALIDGRILGICRSRFMGYALVIPQFVIDELQHVADSGDPARKAKGRKGLETLRELRELKNVDVRINDTEVSKRQKVDAKLIFLAQSLKAKILTTDYNLAQIAEFHNVEWLNLAELAKAVNPEHVVGETIRVELVRAGRDKDQAVGYLHDGSMVVVGNARHLIGKEVDLVVDSIIPSAGGKMVFARLA